MRRFLATLLLLLPLAPLFASAELQPVGWGVVTTAEPKAYDKPQEHDDPQSGRNL